jgi:hypothetical protein
MNNAYKTFAIVIGIHFFIMYALVFSPVNAFADIKIFNLRNFYMAVIMVAPMIFLMLYSMKHMFENKKINLILYTASILIFITGFLAIRTQAFVGNEQIIKSMIPHHSSAITMCEKANITDEELSILCDEIIKTQQEEIDQMNAILQRLQR